MDRIQRILAYAAPFLTAKLVQDHIVENAEEGDALFGELKKYLIIAQSATGIDWPLYSHRIDVVWHEFILFTDAYIDFCQRFFDGYIGHSPAGAPHRPEGTVPGAPATFGAFANRYADLFGAPLPDAWYDEKGITTWRRVFNQSAGTWSLRESGAQVQLLNATGKRLMSVDPAARDALAFIARTGAFYVRELPGGLTDETKIAIVAKLVADRLLRIAP